jgi:hypothetical protein
MARWADYYRDNMGSNRGDLESSEIAIAPFVPLTAFDRVNILY